MKRIRFEFLFLSQISWRCLHENMKSLTKWKDNIEALAKLFPLFPASPITGTGPFKHIINYNMQEHCHGQDPVYQLLNNK